MVIYSVTKKEISYAYQKTCQYAIKNLVSPGMTIRTERNARLYQFQLHESDGIRECIFFKQCKMGGSQHIGFFLPYKNSMKVRMGKKLILRGKKQIRIIDETSKLIVGNKLKSRSP